MGTDEFIGKTSKGVTGIIKKLLDRSFREVLKGCTDKDFNHRIK